MMGGKMWCNVEQVEGALIQSGRVQEGYSKEAMSSLVNRVNYIHVPPSHCCCATCYI